MNISDGQIKNEEDIINYIGDGTDYDIGHLESLSSSIDIIKRITIFTALKSGVTVEELINLHNNYSFEKMIKNLKPVYPIITDDPITDDFVQETKRRIFLKNLEKKN